MGDKKKVNKPCAKCGQMMYNVNESRNFCKFCLYGYQTITLEKRPNHPPYVGPTLREIMIEANKEGLQYVEYCKKHGLH